MLGYPVSAVPRHITAIGWTVTFLGSVFTFIASTIVYSMMTRDGLTGTLNKRSFSEILRREFQRATHRGTLLSLILLDIDHFKSVNDTYGHLAGDEVLHERANRIPLLLRQ